MGICKKISEITGVSRKELSDSLYKTTSSFLWVKRHIPPTHADALKPLKLKGLGFIPTQRRVYPQGNLFGTVLGFVGVDNQGLGGLEYKYDSHFRGSAGKIILERDPRGYQLISGSRETIPPQDGGHIVTTLDPFIQYSAKKHLQWSLDYNNASSGQVLVMNPKNGDILAMVSLPDFNPNDWLNSLHSQRKNTTITDVYEPGSIFKIITMAAVLEEGIVTPGSIITVPETLSVYDRVISEAHEREEEETDQKSVSEILHYSLNVGTALLSQKLGDVRLYKYMKQFGFGQKTEIELPGESRGLLRPVSEWSKVDGCMMSFGQGIAVTSIQMAAAVAAIANNGVYMKPRIIHHLSDHSFLRIKGIPQQQRSRVLRSETARTLTTMMTGVVTEGTAKNIRIPGLSIAGKTGTAQKAKTSGRGYEKGAYIASFIGFFPAENPDYLILVTVDTPKRSIWGSTVAAPVFKKIALDIIDYMAIPLDFSSENF